jgi:thioester reductase-like protein
MHGVAQMGSFPDVDAKIDLTPVDYVAAAIVSLSKGPTAKFYHPIDSKGNFVQNSPFD